MPPLDMPDGWDPAVHQADGWFWETLPDGTSIRRPALLDTLAAALAADVAEPPSVPLENDWHTGVVAMTPKQGFAIVSVLQELRARLQPGFTTSALQSGTGMSDVARTLALQLGSRRTASLDGSD